MFVSSWLVCGAGWDSARCAERRPRFHFSKGAIDRTQRSIRRGLHWSRSAWSVVFANVIARSAKARPLRGAIDPMIGISFKLGAAVDSVWRDAWGREVRLSLLLS